MATDGIYPDLVDGGRVRCLDRQVLSKERGWREAKKKDDGDMKLKQKRQKACRRKLEVERNTSK